MKTYELFKINDILNNSLNYTGRDFSISVFKNKRLIENELSKLRFINEFPKEWEEYEGKRIEICKKYCKKDDDGRDIIDSGRYVIENENDFKSNMEKLYEEYKQCVDERNEKITKFNEISNSDIDLQFSKIKISDLPDEIQTPSDILSFSFMIEE